MEAIFGGGGNDDDDGIEKVDVLCVMFQNHHEQLLAFFTICLKSEREATVKLNLGMKMRLKKVLYTFSRIVNNLY